MGVGIGETAAPRMEIATEAALLRAMRSRHPEAEIAQLEEELLDEFKSLGVRPVGMGGLKAVFDVHIQVGMTHSGFLFEPSWPSVPSAAEQQSS